MPPPRHILGLSLVNAAMISDPFALAAIIMLILLLPSVLFILVHIARRSGQDEWDRAERALNHPLPKRPYTQRYIDALDGEPGPRRPRAPLSRTRRGKRTRPPGVRNVGAPNRSAMMRAVDDDVREARARLGVVNLKTPPPPPRMRDRSGWPRDHMQAHAVRGQGWRGAKMGCGLIESE